MTRDASTLLAYSRIFQAPLRDDDPQIAELTVASCSLPLASGAELQVFLEAVPRVTDERGLHFEMALGLYLYDNEHWEPISQHPLGPEQAASACSSKSPIADLLAANPDWLSKPLKSVEGFAEALAAAHSSFEAELLAATSPSRAPGPAPRL